MCLTVCKPEVYEIWLANPHKPYALGTPCDRNTHTSRHFQFVCSAINKLQIIVFLVLTSLSLCVCVCVRERDICGFHKSIYFGHDVTNNLSRIDWWQRRLKFKRYWMINILLKMFWLKKPLPQIFSRWWIYDLRLLSRALLKYISTCIFRSLRTQTQKYQLN